MEDGTRGTGGGGDDARLDEAVREAERSEELRSSRVALRALHALHERTRAGEATSQYELAEALYGNASDGDRARAAVRTLRARLARLAEGREPGEACLVVRGGPWLLAVEEVPATDTAAAGAAPADGAARDGRPAWVTAALARWRRSVPLRVAAGVTVAAAALGIVAGAASAPRGGPVAIEWRQHSIVALDARGRELWARTLGPPLGPGNAASDRTVVEDLDRDGRVEIGVLPHAGEPAKMANDQLFLFDEDGTLVASPSLAGEIRLGGRLQPPFFHSIAVTTWRPRPNGETLLAVTAGHGSSSASAVVLFDARGVELGRYWHVGHLASGVPWDQDGDGEDELAVGGTNNDRGGAALVVLELEDFLDPARRGGGPHPPGRRESPDVRVAPEQTYVLLRPSLTPRSVTRAGGGPPRRRGDRVELPVGFDGMGFVAVFDRDLRCEVRLGERVDEWVAARVAADPDDTTLADLDRETLASLFEDGVHRFRDGAWDRAP